MGRTKRLKILMDSKHRWESQNQREQLTEGMMGRLVGDAGYDKDQAKVGKRG